MLHYNSSQQSLIKRSLKSEIALSDKNSDDLPLDFAGTVDRDGAGTDIFGTETQSIISLYIFQHP